MKIFQKNRLVTAFAAVCLILGWGLFSGALACGTTPVCPPPPDDDPCDGVVVGEAVIDDQTHGDWLGKYGSCFYLIPDPDQHEYETPIGPDFFREFPLQYEGQNCFGGSLFDDGQIDWRIFRQTVDGSAFAFTLAAGDFWEALSVGEQWNPCKDTFKGATWDNHLASTDPLVVELKLNLTGSAKIAYYFLDAANVCRTEDLNLYVNGELFTDTPVRISDFSAGKFVVFDLDCLEGETIVTLEATLVPQEESDCEIVDPVLYYGVNSHISGVFVDCFPVEPLCFEVNEVKAKDKCGAYFDWLNAKGSMKLADGAQPFDPATDDVTFSMWDETFTIPAGSFQKLYFWGKTLYYYTGRLPDMGYIAMYLDFKKCEWKVYISKKYTRAYIESDGTTISLSIGDNAGSDSFEWTKKYSYCGTNFAKFYEENPTLCCCPQTTCDKYTCDWNRYSCDWNRYSYCDR